MKWFFDMDSEQKRKLWRIVPAALMLAGLRFAGDFRFRWLLYLVPYLVIGYDVLAEAAEGLTHREPFDECFLMAVATVGAMALGEYAEGVAVMLFFQLGELFESVAVGRSRRSISALLDIRPDTAELERADGSTETVSPEAVPVGSVIVVRPGARVPIDGIIIEGSSALDTAALTGESVPRTVRTGDAVQSGCINTAGLLRVRTEKAFGESTASKILELVENAGERKSRSESFIAKFARVYTPVVCFSALALFLVPPLVSLALGRAAAWGQWLYRALTFLVISCPCALVISIPLTFFAALGGASRAGVLIKGSNFVETLAKLRCVVLDKTGTLTKGVFELTECFPVGMTAERLLELVAHAEYASTHPIAQSLVRAYGQEPDASRVSGLTEKSGHGVTAEVDGVRVAVGNLRLMESLGVRCEPVETAGTAVYAAVDGKYAGAMCISDVIKPHAAQAVEALRRTGVKKLVMLTGDGKAAAENAAKTLGLDEVRAELLPADKVEQVERLLSELGKGETLAFVGDGINDAPVLSRADVGIAMGALGSDAAIEAADVVLMDDDPRKLSRAVVLARKGLRIVYENIGFAIGVKLVCLVLGALGIAGMWLAVFADVGVMVLAVLNAVRAMGKQA